MRRYVEDLPLTYKSSIPPSQIFDGGGVNVDRPLWRGHVLCPTVTTFLKRFLVNRTFRDAVLLWRCQILLFTVRSLGRRSVDRSIGAMLGLCSLGGEAAATGACIGLGSRCGVVLGLGGDRGFD